MFPMGVVDIHAHILPSIDDGPDTLAESVKMVKIAYKEGIRTIVCTPHAKKDYDSLAARAQDGLSLVQAKLEQENISVSLLPGFEVLLNEQLLRYEYLKKLAFRLDGLEYMLIEFEFCKFPVYLKEILKRLCAEKIQPVLAHPERYPYLLGNMTFMQNLISDGMMLQINAGSITGEYGRSVQMFAKSIIQNGLADFVATDAHSCSKRGPYIRKALKLLQSWTSPASQYRFIYNLSERVE